MSADISKFLSDMTAIRDRQLAAARRGVDRFGEQVIGDSQELCPVSKGLPTSGSLKASGTTLPAEIHGTVITAVIGHNMSYAAAVHEVLTSHHPQGQAKFLEKAMRDNVPEFAPFMAEEMKKA